MIYKPRTLPFERIAPRYQTVNRILSGGLDRLWRKRLIRELRLADGMSVLDIGVGTGDLLEMIATGNVLKVGVDPEPRMMRLHPDIPFQRITGIGEALPFPDGSFDRIISAFVLRNLTDRGAAFAEMKRVLKPGGLGGILEMSPPGSGSLKVPATFYVRRVVPIIGSWISGDAAAYRYLSRSILAFPRPERISRELGIAGLDAIRWTRLSGGVTVHYTFRKR